MLPVAAQALLEAGQGLIDTFILGTSLLERVMTYSQWPDRENLLTRLDEIVERTLANNTSASNPQQSDLFEQYTKVLQTLAKWGPLLLVVDDLQWADLGSISLLFHLGRHLAGSRILIVGAYRREEVALGRDGKRHPLEPVVNEFQRDFGDVTVNVDQAERRDFVETILDSEPNQLGVAFREMLYQQTRGHPLFTIELLRGMQERGDVIKDPEGRWVEGPTLDWETLPARVEAAIAERIGRLPQPLRAALRVASVEGEDFTAEVVARVLGTDERDMVSQLSSQLDRRHRLVRPKVIQRPSEQRVSRYRFRNYLFQKYLYDNLDQVERAYLHEDVGNRLEEMYGDQASDIAVQLAWHYQEAKIAEKAIFYLRIAGEKAAQLSAYQEGITHLTKAMSLLMEQSDSNERAQQELALQLALGISWQGTAGSTSAEVKKANTRAYKLCQQLGDTTQLCLVLGEMVEFYYVRAEYRKALELAEESLGFAKSSEDPLLLAISHWYLGFILFGLGDFKSARIQLEQVITFYEPQEHHQSFVALRGKDVGVGALAYDACCLWCLGYPDQALKRSQEALTLARKLNHPFSLADVHCFAGCLFNEMRRDGVSLKQNAEELMRLTAEKVPGWQQTGRCYRGESLTMMGQVQEGIIQIREGLAEKHSMDALCYFSGSQGILAEAQAKEGLLVDALDTLDEALAFVEDTDERYWEAELYRLRGKVLITMEEYAQAKISLQKAIEIARHQNAKALELRAATTFARLLLKLGGTDEAYQMLEPIYSWLTEGFDSPDLKEAKALLEELS
jgi:predicted ATPase